MGSRNTHLGSKLMLLDLLAIFRADFLTKFVVQVRIYVVFSFPVFDQYFIDQTEGRTRTLRNA